MLDAILESSVLRLRRLLQTFSADIVEPAMISTPKASVVDGAGSQ